MLGLSLVEYWDKTFHELTYEIAGYNARWEEQMRIERIHYELQYNIHAPKNKKKSAKQLIPLPSDTQKTAFEKRIEELENQVALTAFAKGR